MEKYPATAAPVEGEERDRMYRIQKERDPAFAVYEAQTTRTIPVVTMRRLNLTADLARNRALGKQLVTVHDAPRRDLAAVRRDVDDYLDAPAR